MVPARATSTAAPTTCVVRIAAEGCALEYAYAVAVKTGTSEGYGDGWTAAFFATAGLAHEAHWSVTPGRHRIQAALAQHPERSNVITVDVRN